MRGDTLGMRSGRHGKDRVIAPEQVSTGGRGEHFKHQRTLSEEPMRENQPEKGKKKDNK